MYTELNRMKGYKFELIIDGCNGPIRFREDQLRKAAARVASEDGGDVGNDDETILSLLRPESIAADRKKNQLRSTSNRYKKSTKGRRGEKDKQKTCTVEGTDTAECVEESSNRLDMIPLLRKLLLSSTRNDRDRNPVGNELFDSISVVFDGISITKRPPVPANSPKENNRLEGTPIEEITRGRLWHVTSDASNGTTAVRIGEAGLCNGKENKSGCIAIEVTGLYDEADNVIVERIQEHHCQTIDRERYQPPPTESEQVIGASCGELKGPLAAAVTRVRVLRRTERGAGKNRRLFQPLGLLRPESVACVFEFGTTTPLSTNTTNNNNNSNEGQGEFKDDERSFGQRQKSLGSSSFCRLALDGHQTLRSVRRQNPGNVFLGLDEPLEVPYYASSTIDEDGDASPTILLPIVATDDIFLRQRIVHEGGYVMTFHQLWLLLMDVV